MGERQHQLTIQALGRPSYLGQLYDATTSTLISGFNLFHRGDTVPATVQTSVASTTVDFKEVRSLMDRARSLDISASLSVSILGGAIELSGIGSYLDNKFENSESNTVASLVRIRTMNSTLDVNRLRSMQAMSLEELVATRATHVVTSITYGGNIIGTATQESSLSSSRSDLEGKFTLDIFKGFGKLSGVSGEANVDEHEKERLEKYNLRVRLDGDFRPPKDEDLPTTALELLKTMKRSVSFIEGDGVPCELTLTPLDWFHSGIPTFRELDDADLRSLAELYDRLISLDRNRSWLTSRVEEQRYIFPSFLDTCRKSSNRVAGLVSRARQELRTFLQRYRGMVDRNTTPMEFQREMTGRFTEEITGFESDREKWLLMVEWIRAGRHHGFLLVPISELRFQMNRPDKGSIALVLVPESAQFSTLLQTYRILAGDIRKWQSTLARHATEQTQFLSVYADPQFDDQLKKLDDHTSSIGRALETARKNSDVAFLTYGVSSDGLFQLQWSVINQDGWGILVNREERWRYIGNVKKGLRHGSGIITYADGSIYSGDWIQGKRDGLGKLFPSEEAVDLGKPSAEGVYVDNLLARDGVLVKVTVYRNGAPIQFACVALRSSSSTMSHVSKVARVLGWRIGQKFRVNLESTENAFQNVSVLVNGSRVDPSEDPDVALSSWPLDAVGEKLITVRAL